MHACPRCLDRNLCSSANSYDPRDRADADALACPDCGGVWLTADAVKRVLHGRLGPLSRLRVVPTGMAALRCPACQRELVRRRVADVDIDECGQHGVWFDHREVERIRDAAHHAHPDLPGEDAALAAGLVVATVAVTQSQAPPAMNASAVDIGNALEGTVIVADVALTSADFALNSAEVASAAGELATSGGFDVASSVVDALGSIFDGLF